MSRYDRFREILDQIAGDSSADYGGIGPSWKLDRNRLLEASIFDVQLIAPEKALTRSCCGHGTVETTETTRSARFGLVTGLRGEALLDGSRFPQLPWGGRPVVESDVLFITWWIDDGCPQDNSGGEIGNYPVSTGPITVEHEGYSVYDGFSGEYQFQLRWAFNELYELHGWERFLPWHRMYKYEFEQTSHDHCPEVTSPYWDWTLPQYAGNPILNTFQMFLTDCSLAFLSTHRPVITDKVELLRPIVGKLYPTQSTFFWDVADRIGVAYTVNDHYQRFLDALMEANPLQYPGQFGGSTINGPIHYYYPSTRDFGGGSLYYHSWGFPDQNPPNTPYIWSMATRCTRCSIGRSACRAPTPAT